MHNLEDGEAVLLVFPTSAPVPSSSQPKKPGRRSAPRLINITFSTTHLLADLVDDTAASLEDNRAAVGFIEVFNPPGALFLP